MLVTWKPEGGEPDQEWQFDPGDVGRKDAILIEKHFGGGTWDQWVAALQMGDMQARTVLLWHMLRQIHPKLRFDDVPDFRVRQLTVQMGVAELRKLYDRARRMKMDDVTREAFEAQMEADLAEAMEREGLEGDVKIVDGVLAIEGVKDLPKAQ